MCLSDDYVCQDFVLTSRFNMARPFLQSQQIAWTNFVVIFEINVLGTKAKWHVCQDFSISLQFQ